MRAIGGRRRRTLAPVVAVLLMLLLLLLLLRLLVGLVRARRRLQLDHRLLLLVGRLLAAVSVDLRARVGRGRGRGTRLGWGRGRGGGRRLAANYIGVAPGRAAGGALAAERRRALMCKQDRPAQGPSIWPLGRRGRSASRGPWARADGGGGGAAGASRIH